MATDNEVQAMAHVIDWLAQRFPDKPRSVVEEIVSEEVNALDGPIRDYVPVLVERAAKNRLRR
ncbi:three-helix bundle dimerization domain-containing protein [Pseudarthrobacter sp. MDT3-1]